jgi:hypothetical protein
MLYWECHSLIVIIIEFHRSSFSLNSSPFPYTNGRTILTHLHRPKSREFTRCSPLLRAGYSPRCTGTPSPVQRGLYPARSKGEHRVNSRDLGRWRWVKIVRPFVYGNGEELRLNDDRWNSIIMTINEWHSQYNISFFVLIFQFSVWVCPRCGTVTRDLALSSCKTRHYCYGMIMVYIRVNRLIECFFLFFQSVFWSLLMHFLL